MTTGTPVRVDSGTVPVHRLLCPNPGLMTGPGTNTYLIGDQRMALVDPGPRLPGHTASIMRALDGRPLDWILVTHTHGDHSPGTGDLQQRTGARVVGLPPAQGQHQDPDFRPDRLYQDGEQLDGGEWTVRLVHTPGHVSNHLCFLLCEEAMLFTGDHVLQGTTPVILPPDGNMRDYLQSLQRLQQLPLKALAPGHGSLITQPHKAIMALIRHRLRREQKIINALLSLGSADVETLARKVYDDVPQHLLPWAEKTLLAHLFKLRDEGRAHCEQDRWTPA